MGPLTIPESDGRSLTIQAIEMIEEQAKKIDQKLDALLLVGGFSGSEYLFGRVKVRVNWGGGCVGAKLIDYTSHRL